MVPRLRSFHSNREKLPWTICNSGALTRDSTKSCAHAICHHSSNACHDGSGNLGGTRPRRRFDCSPLVRPRPLSTRPTTNGRARVSAQGCSSTATASPRWWGKVCCHRRYYCGAADPVSRSCEAPVGSNGMPATRRRGVRWRHRPCHSSSTPRLASCRCKCTRRLRLSEPGAARVALWNQYRHALG